jgi:hypothetical protein
MPWYLLKILLDLGIEKGRLVKIFWLVGVGLNMVGDILICYNWDI